MAGCLLFMLEKAIQQTASRFGKCRMDTLPMLVTMFFSLIEHSKCFGYVVHSCALRSKLYNWIAINGPRWPWKGTM